MKTILLIGIFVWGAFISIGAQSGKSEQVERSDSNGYVVFDGDKAPDFNVTLTDGRRLKLSDLQGKLVMIQFTASWCGVCRKEMPFIERDIWQKHKNDTNFVLIGIDRDEPLEKVLKFAKQTGVTYPLGLDPGADIYAKYALRQSGITRNILIDKDGIIIKRTRLYKEEEFNSLVEAIDNYLKKKK
jgi:peroxiredoxin